MDKIGLLKKVMLSLLAASVAVVVAAGCALCAYTPVLGTSTAVRWCDSVKPGTDLGQIERMIQKVSAADSIDYSKTEIDVVLGDSVCMIVLDSARVAKTEVKPRAINY